MNMNNPGKALSASSIHRFMDGTEHKKLKATCELLLHLGLSIIPSSFSALAEEPQLSEAYQFLNQEATSQIFGRLATAFCEWVLTENDDNRAENMQTAYNMCFYSAFFDAVRDDFLIEGDFDVDACLLELPKRASITHPETEKSNASFAFYSEDEIKAEYIMLSQLFKQQFFSIRDIAELVKEHPEQELYFSKSIDSLPESALQKYKALLLSLERGHEAFERWYSSALQNEILNRLPQDSRSKKKKGRSTQKRSLSR